MPALDSTPASGTCETARVAVRAWDLMGFAPGLLDLVERGRSPPERLLNAPLVCYGGMPSSHACETVSDIIAGCFVIDNLFVLLTAKHTPGICCDGNAPHRQHSLVNTKVEVSLSTSYVNVAGSKVQKIAATQSELRPLEAAHSYQRASRGMPLR